MGEPLPEFVYHPDPVATGSVIESDGTCSCCGRTRGFAYVGPVYSAEEVEGLCPWCIADASAAERFNAEFTDVAVYADESVPADVMRVVLRQTPGFSGWQQEQWMFHCSDAAEYLGEMRAADMAEHPAIAEMFAVQCREAGLSEGDTSRFLVELGNNDALGYGFQCRHCGTELGYWDSA